MNKNDLSVLNLRIKALSVFRCLLKDEVILSLSEFLDSLEEADFKFIVSKYGEFVNKLYLKGDGNLSAYIAKVTDESENVYVRMKGAGKEPNDAIKKAACEELKTLQEIADITKEKLTVGLENTEFLADFSNENIDFLSRFLERSQNIGKYGYGIFADNRMFYLGADGKIIPVKNPDKIRFSDLVDYERERGIILDNTKALISGRPAANVLLTGDAGTGKSSTVKAIVNELASEGLRIVEVRKDQLREIAALLDELSLNPLKFIIFIDDLSFAKDDDNFGSLKAVLEGSVSAKSKNVAIYATSNRRHIVKEKFSDREGDDVHRNDTMQEIISLSERFGIHVTFSKPDKNTFLNIVHHLAKERGLKQSKEELDMLAERFALSRGGRSARLAKQLIDNLSANDDEI